MKHNLSLVGAAGGAVATLAMAAVMAGAQRAGFLGKMPPRRIVDVAARLFGGRPRSEPLRRALTAGAHLGFGSVAGALFGAFLPPGRGRLPRPLLGAAYGAGVWALSYAGWIPALGILPPPERDRPGRPAAMLLSHLVYGAVLGAACGASQAQLKAPRPEPGQAR